MRRTAFPCAADIKFLPEPVPAGAWRGPNLTRSKLRQRCAFELRVFFRHDMALAVLQGNTHDGLRHRYLHANDNPEQEQLSGLDLGARNAVLVERGHARYFRASGAARIAGGRIEIEQVLEVLLFAAAY